MAVWPCSQLIVRPVKKNKTWPYITPDVGRGRNYSSLGQKLNPISYSNDSYFRLLSRYILCLSVRPLDRLTEFSFLLLPLRILYSEGLTSASALQTSGTTDFLPGLTRGIDRSRSARQASDKSKICCQNSY